MNLAYDFERWPRTSLNEFLYEWSGKFGLKEKERKEVGDIMARYSVSEHC